jgi:ribosome biogenesis GTPase A
MGPRGVSGAAAAAAFRTAFDHSRAAAVNWYPGHMATATRRLDDAMRHVDLVLEVRDARVPLSSSPGGRVEETLRRAKSRLVVLNKADLACGRSAAAVREQLRSADGGGLASVHLDAREVSDIQRLLKIVRAKATKAQRAAEFRTLPYRIAVVGVPNTGKSTLLNGLKRSATGQGGRVAKTGDTPGITKHLSYSRVSHRPPVMVLDTPGIMPPGNLAPEVGLAVALTGGVAVSEVLSLLLVEKRQLCSALPLVGPARRCGLRTGSQQNLHFRDLLCSPIKLSTGCCSAPRAQDKLLDMELLAGKKHVFCDAIFIPKMIILPRQALDKHRESTEK